MKRCLNDKELLMVHSGDGSNEARAHLESCLSCTRKYRDLQGDVETLVATLRQPRPHSARPRILTLASPWPRGLGWSLAASAIIAAFVCGRATGVTGTALRSPFSPTAATVPSAPQISATQIAMADNEGAEAPAAYGLYIDDLMGLDNGDQGQTADGQDTENTDDQADADASSF